MTGSRSWPKFWIWSWPKRVMTQSKNLGHDPSSGHDRILKNIKLLFRNYYWTWVTVMTQFILWVITGWVMTEVGSWPRFFFGSWPESVMSQIVSFFTFLMIYAGDTWDRTSKCRSQFFDTRTYTILAVISLLVLIFMLILYVTFECLNVYCFNKENMTDGLFFMSFANLIAFISLDFQYFEFARCYNFSRYVSVVLRSGCVILLIIIMFSAALYLLVFFCVANHLEKNRELY